MQDFQAVTQPIRFSLLRCFQDVNVSAEETMWHSREMNAQVEAQTAPVTQLCVKSIKWQQDHFNKLLMWSADDEAQDNFSGNFSCVFVVAELLKLYKNSFMS